MTDQDRDIIFQLASELIGASQPGQVRQETLVTNVQRRMNQLGQQTLADYLTYVDQNDDERAHLISALTIHTTSWFRENPHFVKFQELLLNALSRNEVFRVWCGGCSTGEEVYSFAIMLEEFRTVHPQFDYRILGTDIDPISVKAAKRAVYSGKQLNFHLSRYKHHLLEGSGKTQGYFTLSKEIRARCEFRVHDLRQPLSSVDGQFHVVVCRNVLIYFDPSTVQKIVSHLVRPLTADGRLLLGHSEHIAAAEFSLIQEGHSVYTRGVKEDIRKARQSMVVKYRILCVDDAPLARKSLEKNLHEMGFNVTTVSSGTEATNFLNFNDVDLVTLDLNMPDVSGDRWLQTERREGLKVPVVILSEVHPSDAPEVVKLLSLGAQDYIEKHQLSNNPAKVKDTILELIRSSKKVDKTAVSGFRGFPKQVPEIVMIGASTGGPQALTKVLKQLPSQSPAVMVTQHISAKFSRPLAERLADVSGLKLGQPEDGSLVLPGHLYMSFGDYHIGVGERNGQLIVTHSSAQPFNGHRPSVDVMFNSALGIKHPMMAVLLTGMGRDGALGMRFLKQEGVFCVAQSEEDCVVYGMPREVIERDAVDFVGNLDEIHKLFLDAFQSRNGTLLKTGTSR